MKTPAAELMPREPNGSDYVQHVAGWRFKRGDRVRLKDRDVVCTLDGPSEHEHRGVRFRMWLAHLPPHGGWVSIIEVDMPIH